MRFEVTLLFRKIGTDQLLFATQCDGGTKMGDNRHQLHSTVKFAKWRGHTH